MRGFYANVIPKQIILDPDCFNDKDGLGTTTKISK